jgi:hypothetical protein
MDLRNIQWKSGNAREEIENEAAKFSKDFLPIEDIALLKEPHHLFIWGARGMGKTALAWHHARKNPWKEVIAMDFEEGESWVNAIIQKVTRFTDFEFFPAMLFMESAWYEAVLSELMRKLLRKDLITCHKDSIVRFLHSQSSDHSILQALYRGIEGIEDLLQRHGALVPDPVASKVGAGLSGLKLTTKGILFVSQYFRRKVGFQEAVDALCLNLRNMPARSILIIVDSVDKFMMPAQFPEAPKEHRGLCLTVRALCKALLQLHQRKEFYSAFEIKVFLPIDMKNSMKDRSYEHELIHHHNIRWTADELAMFIAKQMSTQYDGGIEAQELIRETWDRLFPYHIENTVTRVKHRPLDYLLRHTHYRPRQLIFCCRAMTEAAKKAQKKDLAPEEFREVTHEYCREASGRILNEFKAAYPTIFEIIHKFEDSSNILPREKVYKLLSSLKMPPMLNDPEDLVQLLYDMGFLGVIKDEEHERELGLKLPYTTVSSKTYHFAFTYLHPRFSVVTEKTFVIHPSFYSRFNFKIDSHITVAQNAHFTNIYTD